MSESVNENSSVVIDAAAGLVIPRSKAQTFFIAAIVAIIAGLLFPDSARIYDLFLIFSLSLTGAVLIISFSARGAQEVSGFPSLVVLATMLRVAISVASTKQVGSQSNSIIISFFGSTFIRNNSGLTILFFVMLMIIIFGAICKAVKNIRHTSGEFTTNIVPIKQINIESDFNTGIIDAGRVLNLRDKVYREATFFSSMAGVAGFIFCAAVIELTIVIVNIFGRIIAGATYSTTTEASAETYSLAVGAGMTMQTAALLIAVASSYLVRKSCVSGVRNDETPKKEFAKRIKVVANEMVSQEPVEAQDENTLFLTQAESIVKDVEWLDEPQRHKEATETNNSHKWLWRTGKDNNYYEAIAELILSKSMEGAKTIMMAAGSTKELPVTVPVNIAMRLAEKKQECLLIDLDFERGAISQVFDIEDRDIREQKGAIGTCISGLRVWPGFRQMQSREDKRNHDVRTVIQTIKKLEGQYDCLIVYAPNIKLLGDLNVIAGCIKAVMFFGPGDKIEGSGINEVYKILNSGGCEILKASEVPAEAVQG